MRLAAAALAFIGIMAIVTRQPVPSPDAPPPASASAAEASPAPGSPAADATAGPSAAPASPEAATASPAVTPPDDTASAPPGTVVQAPGDATAASASSPGSSPDAPGPVAASPSPAPTPAKPSKALFAKREIPEHTRFFPSNIDRYLIEREVIADPGSEAFTQGTTEVLDLVTRQIVPPGDMLQRSKLMSHTEVGGLSVAIPDGMRAIAISLNNEKGVGGFISQGDRIDILHHFTILNKSRTYVVLQNVKVLAINASYVVGRGPGQPAPPPQPPGQEQRPDVVGGRVTEVVRAETLSDVVLEVTPEQAARIIEASNVGGSMSMVLRSAESTKDGKEPDAITDRMLYSDKQGQQEEAADIQEVEVYRATNFEKSAKETRRKRKATFEQDPQIYIEP